MRRGSRRFSPQVYGKSGHSAHFLSRLCFSRRFQVLGSPKLDLDVAGPTPSWILKVQSRRVGEHWGAKVVVDGRTRWTIRFPARRCFVVLCPVADRSDIGCVANRRSMMTRWRYVLTATNQMTAIPDAFAGDTRMRFCRSWEKCRCRRDQHD